MEIKVGHLIDIINENIRHKVSTRNSSSCSYIILLSNFKVIGIHKDYDEDRKFNIGTNIKHIIECINFENTISEINN